MSASSFRIIAFHEFHQVFQQQRDSFVADVAAVAVKAISVVVLAHVGVAVYEFASASAPAIADELAAVAAAIASDR